MSDRIYRLFGMNDTALGFLVLLSVIYNLAWIIKWIHFERILPSFRCFPIKRFSNLNKDTQILQAINRPR